jgi:hypothetical protein
MLIAAVEERYKDAGNKLLMTCKNKFTCSPYFLVMVSAAIFSPLQFNI